MKLRHTFRTKYFWNVSAPPRIDVSLSTKVVYSYIGNPRRLQFQCYFWGYPIPEMKITKNNKLLSNNNVEKEERSITGFLRTEKESDFGPYTCEAENDRGKASYAVEIKPAGESFKVLLIYSSQYLLVKTKFCHCTKRCCHITISWLWRRISFGPVRNGNTVKSL